MFLEGLWAVEQAAVPEGLTWPLWAHSGWQGLGLDAHETLACSGLRLCLCRGRLVWGSLNSSARRVGAAPWGGFEG